MMYGFIGKLTAVSGQRDALVSVLMEASTAVPGRLSYVVARDPQEPNSVWVTEVWESKDRHSAALELPSVKTTMARCTPLIAAVGLSSVTQPVGGYGLS